MRGKKMMTVAAAIFGATALTAVTPASASTVGGIGHLWNYSDTPKAECVAVPGGDLFYGNTIMWTCDSEGGQQWMVVDAPGFPGYFQLVDPNAACLGTNASTAEGARVAAETCDEQHADQIWSTNGTNGKGYYELQNLESGYCLSVSGGSVANDATVIQWKCQGTADQYWEGAAAFK